MFGKYMMRIAFLLAFAALVAGCSVVHRGSSIAHVTQASDGRYEARLSSVEWVAGGPCNFPQWPHRQFGTCWVYTDSTNGVVAADRVSLAYASSDGFRATQEGPLHGSVQFRSDQMVINLQLPCFTDGGRLDHYEKFELNGVYKVKAP